MRLGWYIHHHGRGHLHRFLSVLPHLGGDTEVTVLTSLARPSGLAGPTWIRLPLDVPVSAAGAGSVAAGGLLHWAPLDTPGYTERMGRVAAWLTEARPDAVVVDVSVEVALLVRLLGVPVVWVAQRGERVDTPHRLAYTAASSVIAPWTEATAEPASSGLPAERTRFVGALSRFDHHPAPPSARCRGVLLLLGFGGHAVTGADVAAAARATPGWSWDVTGIGSVFGDGPENVRLHPPEADVWGLLADAAVVVATASGNAIAEVAAARRPLICLPQARPFDEQRHQAVALERAGLATALAAWPAPERWGELLDTACRRDAAGWRRLHDRGGAVRFARAVTDAACA